MRAQQESLPTALRYPGNYSGVLRRPQGSGPGSQGAQGSKQAWEAASLSCWPPAPLPPSLDEPPSSWLGSWSHVASPPHTGSPQPHAQSTSVPRSSGCSPRGEPRQSAFQGQAYWWAEAWAPPAGIKRPPGFWGGRSVPPSSVCGGAHRGRPTPDSPSPAQLTNLQKHKPLGFFCLAGSCPEDGGWCRPEPSAARGRGAEGQVSRSQRSGAAPPSPGRPGGAQPHTQKPTGAGAGLRTRAQAAREGRSLGPTASPRNVPIIHSIGCRPRLCPGLA